MPPPGVRDSALWARAVKDAKSKFKRFEGFGKKVTGHILLTDHKDRCEFRNLKIRELK